MGSIFVNTVFSLRIIFYFSFVLNICKTIHTANSIKVDIDNSQMCIMIDRVPKNDDSLHVNVKDIIT